MHAGGVGGNEHSWLDRSLRCYVPRQHSVISENHGAVSVQPRSSTGACPRPPKPFRPHATQNAARVHLTAPIVAMSAGLRAMHATASSTGHAPRASRRSVSADMSHRVRKVVLYRSPVNANSSPVIVTDGESRSALAITRSLGAEACGARTQRKGSEPGCCVALCTRVAFCACCGHPSGAVGGDCGTPFGPCWGSRTATSDRNRDRNVLRLWPQRSSRDRAPTICSVRRRHRQIRNPWSRPRGSIFSTFDAHRRRKGPLFPPRADIPTPWS